jgi:hypothetical protein
MQRKQNGILRVWMQNVNRLPSQNNTSKSKQLISTIAHKQVDIALITEVGLYWRLVHANDQWHERTREAFQVARFQMAYNTTEPDISSPTQFGGVGIMAIDDVAHRVVGQGQDLSGLGRWAWIRLEGKQKHYLRVVSAYGPVSGSGHGPSTVHAQHERYLQPITTATKTLALPSTLISSLQSPNGN